jgi:rhamnogalacturonan endolyase
VEQGYRPFLIYCNSGSNPEAMWKEALNQADKESKAWPYDWVQGVDYPHKNERATVKGQVVLNDPQAPGLKMSNVLVGLSAPDYLPPRMNRSFGGPGSFSFTGGGEDEGNTNATRTAEAQPRPESETVSRTNQNNGRGAGRGRGGFSGPRVVDWQNDAKFYQFWVRGDERGGFKIPNVRAGNYTLHVIADGVLGEATKTNVTLRPGEALDLGRLQWKPLHFGRPLWEIGVPNRSAEEFRHGDHYWQWGLYHRYTNDFPNDVNFVIGKSNYRTDWNYAQLPRSSSQGSTWSINFALTNAPAGKATLRIGIAGVSLRGGVQVTVNDSAAGNTGPLQDTATIRRDGIRGYWSERNVTFDAALLQRGANVIRLIVPGGGATSGIQYDYLRLELDETVSTVAGKN